MKKKLLSASIFLSILTGFTYGQDEKRSFLYLETGIDLLGCEAPVKDYIRGDIYQNQYDINPGPDFVSDQVTNLLHADFLGLKFEYRILNNKLGVAGGLRYTRVVSSIGKSSYWSDVDEKYFYLQYAQNGTNTEYAKVREITQKSGYLGIPLELNFYPFTPHNVNLYFKAGATFNFNIASHTDLVFWNEEMEPYEEEVAKVIEDPYPFYSSLYLGFGLQIRPSGKPGFNLEFCVPAGMITAGENGFYDPRTGVGFRLTFRIPF
jgi:hypothetical protein